MAYTAPDPNAQTPGQLAPQPGQAPISSGGAGVGGSSKAAATPGQNVPAQPSAQLSAYLGANQPQAAALGQNVAQTVGGQVNAAGAAILPAVNVYSGEQYSVPTDTATNTAVETSPSSLTPTQTQSFENELGASAQAPNSANTFEASSAYAPLETNIQNAVEQANLWGAGNNVADLSTALQPFEGANATTGDTTLDSLLLSQTPGAYGQIQSAVAPAAALQGQLAAGATSADQSLQSAIQADQAATPAAQGAAQQYVTGLNGTLAQYLAAAQGNTSAYNNQVNGISGDEAQLQSYISALQNDVSSFNGAIPDNSISQLFSPLTMGSAPPLPSMAASPTVGQLATPGQYSDVAALQALLGQSGFGALGSQINPAQASQAGTYAAPNGGLSASNAIEGLSGAITNPLATGEVADSGLLQSLGPTMQAQTMAQYLNQIMNDQTALQKAAGTIAGIVSPPPVIAPPGTGTRPI
jgi:hypothetical protein